MPNNQRIYLDHSATTPVDPEVLEAMLPYYKNVFGNPSSVHSFGQEAVRGVDMARETIADFFGCATKEIIFTGGATESNNLALQGVIKYCWQTPFFKDKKIKPHIITSSIEHPAILEPCEDLVKNNLAEVTYLPVNKEGLVEVQKVKNAIKENTVLVSIMYVNNEVGTIQPIAEIGELIKQENQQRKSLNVNGSASLSQSRDGQLSIVFHSDATQALSYCEPNVKKLGVDLLSLSAHKIYGPKGVGALFINNGTGVKPIQLGGHQERGFRSGTYNVAGIVGLGKAIEIIKKTPLDKRNLELEKLRNYLIEEVTKKIPNVQVNGSMAQRIASNAHFTFLGSEGESILLMLDMENIAVSTGSACSSGSLSPSHVLTAMGIGPEASHASLRVTLGKYNTKEEIDKFVEVLARVVGRLREMAP